MLTSSMRVNARKELNENYRRLGMDEREVLMDTQMSSTELHAVLTMRDADPGLVWELRDYLEDKLTEKGIEMYPFSFMADHSNNRWFAYDTPWR